MCAISLGIFKSIALDNPRRDHCHHGYDQPDPHSLQLGQARGARFFQFSNKWVEDATIEEDEEGHTKNVKARHACRWDVEVRDGGFHGCALLDKERGHLSEDNRVNNSTEPNWEQS